MEYYKLLPYTAIDGIPTFPDSFIRGLFERMQEEDLVEDLFYDGSITTPDEFLSMLKFGKNSAYVVEYQGKIGGVVWLNNFGARSAECHFCFFSNLTGRALADVGKRVITELINMEKLNGEPIFDVIIGITPVDNRAALRFCRRLGFGIVGIMPKAVYNAKQGVSVAAQYCYIERGKYGQEERFNHHHK